MNIGLIGAGAIAHFLLEEMNQKQQKSLHIQSVLVRDKEKYQTLEKQFGVTLFTDLEAFLDSKIDIVVEAADINALKALVPVVIKRKSMVVISVGALADGELLAEIADLTEKYKNEIYLPSGAVGGLDLIQNAHSLGTVTSVSLTTRKPARSLMEEEMDEPQIVFEGKAADAISQYPKNMNVSIILALAGIGLERTSVCLIADPHIEKNVHHVEVTGDFGEAAITIQNNPLPKNPKTSYLAALSILGTLKRIDGKLKIGG